MSTLLGERQHGRSPSKTRRILLANVVSSGCRRPADASAQHVTMIGLMAKTGAIDSAIATPRTARIPSHMFGIQSCLFMRNTEVGAHELARRAATRVQSRTSCNRACAPLTPQPLRGVRTQSSLRLRSVSAPCPRRERDCEDTYTPTDRILCQPTARERLACSPPESIVASF